MFEAALVYVTCGLAYLLLMWWCRDESEHKLTEKMLRDYGREAFFISLLIGSVLFWPWFLLGTIVRQIVLYWRLLVVTWLRWRLGRAMARRDEIQKQLQELQTRTPAR